MKDAIAAEIRKMKDAIAIRAVRSLMGHSRVSLSFAQVTNECASKSKKSALQSFQTISAKTVSMVIFLISANIVLFLISANIVLFFISAKIVW